MKTFKKDLQLEMLYFLQINGYNTYDIIKAWYIVMLFLEKRGVFLA